MKKDAFYDKIASLIPTPLEERTAAVLLLLWEGPMGPELVFERRSARLRRQAGEICLPGGGVEAGEDPAAAALRECAEELGLNNVQLLSHAESLRHRTGERVEVYVGRVESLVGMTLNPEEVAEAFTVPLSWLRNQPPRTARLALRPDYVRSSPELHGLLEGYGRETTSPLWVWQGRIIWGLTARIVERFLRRTERWEEL